MLFSKRFQLTLIQKLMLSFIISGVCMLVALVYSVSGLGMMHRMEEDIARNDLVAATTIVSLRELLLAQERYVGRFQILRQPEFDELYRKNAEKFRAELVTLRRVYPGKSHGTLVANYNDYVALTGQLFSGASVAPAALKEAAEKVGQTLAQLRSEQQHLLEYKLKQSDVQESRVVTTSLGLAFGGVFIAFLVSFVPIYFFASSIGKLQKATHRIAEGDFDHDPCIPPGDEIGALAEDFIRMARRLKELEQLSLDASPLTRLPGNIAIERCLNRRLRERSSFAMCYMDLDNFKSYNDRYGYIRASELLKDTGRVIHEAVKQLDDADAFVGHIGGDDFVAIISEHLAATACQRIIRDFDAMIPSYYSEEDQLAGAIKGVDRYGVPRVFPLVSISIAALVCMPDDYSSAAEIATAAAEVKDHVKESSGSNYIIIREAGTCEA